MQLLLLLRGASSIDNLDKELLLSEISAHEPQQGEKLTQEPPAASARLRIWCGLCVGETKHSKKKKRAAATALREVHGNGLAVHLVKEAIKRKIWGYE